MLSSAHTSQTQQTLELSSLQSNQRKRLVLVGRSGQDEMIQPQCEHSKRQLNHEGIQSRVIILYRCLVRDVVEKGELVVVK